MVAGEVVVAVADLLHHRFVGETDVSGVLTPGVEPASRRRVDRRGKLTLDIALTDIDRWCRLRDRRQQRTGVRVSGVFVELVGILLKLIKGYEADSS